MFKGFQERILGQLFRILLILHDAYNQDKYLLTVFIVPCKFTHLIFM